MANKTILIADDDAGLVKALKLRLQKLGVSVQTASNGLETLRMLSRKAPDLLILDINMPAADGLSVCETLMTDPKHSPVPVIFFSGRSDPETIRRCEALGAHYVVKDTDTWARLKPLVHDLLRDQRTTVRPSEVLAAARAEPLVVFIDDDVNLSEAVKAELHAYGVKVMTTSGSEQGLKIVKSNKPDVIVTDHVIREGDEESLLVHLKEDPLLRYIPVIVIAERTENGEKNIDLEDELLNRRGAAGYLTKPLELGDLLDHLRRYVKLSTGPSRSKSYA